MSDLTAKPVPADNAAVVAHIALLQGIINRLAGNSAACKTWCITLVGALLALYGTLHGRRVLVAAVVPVTIFAVLDAAYLAQERLYRKHFDTLAVKLRHGRYTAADLYTAHVVRITPGPVWRAFWSWSVAPSYGALALGYAVAFWSGWVLTQLRSAL